MTPPPTQRQRLHDTSNHPFFNLLPVQLPIRPRRQTVGVVRLDTTLSGSMEGLKRCVSAPPGPVTSTPSAPQDPISSSPSTAAPMPSPRPRMTLGAVHWCYTRISVLIAFGLLYVIERLTGPSEPRAGRVRRRQDVVVQSSIRDHAQPPVSTSTSTSKLKRKRKNSLCVPSSSRTSASSPHSSSSINNGQNDGIQAQTNTRTSATHALSSSGSGFSGGGPGTGSCHKKPRLDDDSDEGAAEPRFSMPGSWPLD